VLVALRSPVRIPVPERKTEEFAFLERRFSPRTVFMEIGGSDCNLALRAAGYVERVYAVDVAGRFLHGVLVPCNLRLVLGNGVHIPVPEASVDVAWSGAFMDPLHPDDLLEHLQSVRRSLAPGGEYLFRTRLPAGALRKAGFCRVRAYVGAAPIPLAIAALMPGQVRFAAAK
jgi:hypothetical protein